jgi:hypothetical protein
MKSQIPLVGSVLHPTDFFEASNHELSVSVSKYVERGSSPVRVTREFLARWPHDLIVLSTEGSKSRPNWLHRSDAEAIAKGSGAISLRAPPTTGIGLMPPVRERTP